MWYMKVKGFSSVHNRAKRINGREGTKDVSFWVHEGLFVKYFPRCAQHKQCAFHTKKQRLCKGSELPNSELPYHHAHPLPLRSNDSLV